jgi:lipopolysaccharide biosynthesis glycosyltransferase
MARYPVTLLYLVAPEGPDPLVTNALAAFGENIRKDHPAADVRLIELRATVFDDYVQRYHFSSAILYKLVLPQVFADYEHIVLFDCGMLFGQRVAGFLERIAARAASDATCAIEAFCVDPDGPGALSEQLQQLPHNALYPAGVILYFNVRKYAAAQVYARLVAAFGHYKGALIYAEQDLLCLTLGEGELGALAEHDARHHIDMADQASWYRMPEYEALVAAGDYLYLKHIGSFKPWKKWILHPAKALYLRALARLAPVVGEERMAVLYDEHAFPADTRFLQQQLSLLESYYGKSEVTVP